MARKTKEDAQKTRDAILDAAERVFYAQGYSNTTMADIADHAQLSRGAVYGHYHGKLDVAMAMTTRAIDAVKPFTYAPATAALANLQRYCLDEIKSYIESSAIQRVLFFLYLGINHCPELMQVRLQWEAKRIAQIDALLLQAQQQGELSAECDLAMLSLFCQSTIEGIFSILYFGNHDPDTRWQMAEQLCTYALQRLSMPTLSAKAV